MERVIFHCDCNSFFASVELLDFPAYAKLPVAVCGSADSRHGIVLAKNEIAKKYKIKTAETLWQAQKKCPDLVVLPPHHQKYKKYSIIINQIYSNYTDRVEPFGMDESWLDMSGSWQLFGTSPLAVADRLRKEVEEKTGLTISVGISFNKVFAKMGSDYKKPNATTEITRDNYKQILWPLPVNTLLFVGQKAEQNLKELNIHTIGDLAVADEELLLQVMGKLGPQLKKSASGQDQEPVLKTGEREPVKSVGNGLTFKRNLIGYQDIRTAVGSLADEVAVRLRKQGLYATAVSVLIKNPDLKSISRQKSLPFATNLSKDLTDTVIELLKANWDFTKPIRMLTITAQSLTEVPFATQTSFLDPMKGQDKKREKLETSMDLIRSKYGKNAIVEAGILNNDIGLTRFAQIEEDLEEEE